MDDSIEIERHLNMIDKTGLDNKSGSLKPLSQPTNFDLNMHSGVKLFPVSASHSTKGGVYLGDD